MKIWRRGCEGSVEDFLYFRVYLFILHFWCIFYVNKWWFGSRPIFGIEVSKYFF